ncbi:MAG: adenylate/guanylate cyclase domain-containing protein [Acidimicrobiales bacterium]
MEGFDPERARATGAATVESLRRMLARKAANLIRSDPEEAAKAIEMGLVDRRWLDRPGEGPVSTSTPAEVLERYLQRAVEQRPSRLGSLGLNALQLLAWHGTPEGGDPQPVTVVFTDLEGFTAFTDEHGDDAALGLIQEHHRSAGPVVRRWGGRIVKHLGDGLLCTFSQPEAGIWAGLELLGAAPAPLRLRAGLHVGEAIVSRADVVGQVVNVAARVTDMARGGQVMVTTEVVEAAGPVEGIEFGRARLRRLKGISERVGVCEAKAAAHKANPA